VAAGQKRHEHPLEHCFLSDDDALHFEQCGFERVVDDPWVSDCVELGA
jgi:hypothetical protein